MQETIYHFIISQNKKKHNKENEAILKVLETLDENNDFLSLWEKFEQQIT